MLRQPAFGHRLRKLRMAQGLSQTALAGEGMSTSYLSRLESGARQPTDRAVGYLAGRLGLEAHDFQEQAGGSLTQALTLAASTGSPDAIEALRRALAAEGHESALLRWQALWQLARAARLQGDHPAERDHLARLVELGEETDVGELRVRGLTRLARCLRSLGEITPALDAAVEAHRIALGEDLGVEDRAAALLALVSVTAEAGRVADARVHADELTALLRGRSDTLWAEAMWTAAAVRVRQGDHTGAQACLDEALERFGSQEDLVLWTRLRLATARLHLEKLPAEPARAEHRAAEAEAALAFVATPALRQDLTALKADLAYATGHYDQARALLAALAADQPRMTYRGQVRLEILRHQLLILDGDPQGIQGLRDLAQQAQRDANIDLAAEIWRVLADALTPTAPTRHPAPPPGPLPAAAPTPPPAPLHTPHPAPTS
ncbi:helix-turn-helix domain-containing protein [Streptomyces subrutilus]|uniref:Helix-turn-helix domain-containing protein n=3 Tax=Streptomyces subrutilus TaxID=36818 RepID=A0A5P2UTD4_9ACTN|nr:helix-turn-helix transcriptional regulator [Streptomyces subrutilus]QEU82612.1 helix-turn-helix domain-containing protein [Streptomyces subrutilus]WSJ27924.1 helix-turn-helix domain-containing protein [Streptomyces subrutilus]